MCECVCCVYAVCFCFHSLPFTRMAHRHEHEHEHWYTEHDYDTCMRILWMSMYWFELIIICFLDRLHFSEAVSLRALSSSLSHSIFFSLLLSTLCFCYFFSFKFVLMYACKCHRKIVAYFLFVGNVIALNVNDGR